MEEYRARTRLGTPAVDGVCRSAVTSLLTEKKIPLMSQIFPDENAGKMSYKCTSINPNSPCTSRTKTNYNVNKVQVSYSDELPQSNFFDYTNSLSVP